MSCLCDSNLLLRLSQQGHAQNREAQHATQTLLRRRERVCVFPQNLTEYWAVATRPPESNGLGLSVADAFDEVQRIKQAFEFVADTPAIYPLWEQIVVRFGVQGKQVHDARLVAAMQAHGIGQVLTFNTSDFVRCAPLGITMVHPARV